ncbi:hypothetical protein RND81_14G193700 [Saponaria officinalis]|uniref:NB-ARC domain-containing protein n=1 Tax=Saponaria officinalis TaxID=3572 RepID=A0AAW1GPZ0_SAPOF
MTKDTEITKIVFQVMVGEQKVMKKLVREDREMQLIVEKAMRVLEGEAVEGINQVMVQVVNDITMEFKKLIKEDEKMALAATKLLPDEDLEKLKRDDSEMAVAIEKGRDSNYKNFLENYRGDGDKQVGNVKEHLDEDSIKVATSDLLKPLERLIKIDKFKRVLPETLSVVVDVMEKISASLSKLEIVDEKKLEKQRYRDCCSAVFISYYHSRYLLSKAAKSMAERIQGHMISNYPVQVTEPKSLQELKTIPSGSISLESREKLALEIVRNLKDHEVNVVGVHGMGGSGKTILVKEVANNRAIKQSFKSIVYVEISEAPNVKHIQDHIAQQLEMSLPYEHSLSQRARMLYNRLTSEEKQESKDGVDKGKDILIIMDNIWKKFDLEELGIPDQNTKESCCKLLLTSREADVCKAMGVREEIHEVGVLSENEAWDLFRKQLDKRVDLDHEYKSIAEKLLKKCGGLPLAIVGTANALKGKELSAWEHFSKELEKPISSQDADIHREAYSILQTSYKLMENNLKKRFFLLSCLFPPGSSIRVSDMMRYGIGLGLFQNVNNLTQAMVLADEWAKQLVSSSLLLEDDKDGYVKIHDVVRASIIQFAPKGNLNSTAHLFSFFFKVELKDVIFTMYSKNINLFKNDHEDPFS